MLVLLAAAPVAALFLFAVSAAFALVLVAALFLLAVSAASKRAFAAPSGSWFLPLAWPLWPLLVSSSSVTPHVASAGALGNLNGHHICNGDTRHNLVCRGTGASDPLWT